MWWKRLLQKRWPWLTAMGLVAIAYLSSFVQLRIGGSDRDDRPRGGAAEIATLRERDDVNVLFVLIDTLRADRLSGYGYSRETSPLLDALASRGVRFANHLSQSSWTKCSMASLWTGVYPARSRITRFDEVIPPAAKLPAEILREAGFRTTGLWRNGWVAPSFGFGQGFEVYDRPTSARPPASLRRENPTVQEGGTDEDSVRAAIEFLRVHGNERWFLYMHLMDLHEYTYDEDSARFGSTYADVYDNSVLRVNLVLDRLMGELAVMGMLDRTLIAIASDHGEAFGEHGAEGHARNVYREVTEVPLILSFPFRLDPGLVVESRTDNVDVWPTLLDLLGLPAPPAADGRSRVPEILAAARGEAPPAETRATYAHLDQRWGQRDVEAAPTVAVLDGGFRFVLTELPRGVMKEELFDDSLDHAERRNLLEQHPDVAKRLAELARGHLASEPAPWAAETSTLELDELELNQLRALGYAIP
jgi:arylsulfatase A-like enzyme